MYNWILKLLFKLISIILKLKNIQYFTLDTGDGNRIINNFHKTQVQHHTMLTAFLPLCLLFALNILAKASNSTVTSSECKGIYYWSWSSANVPPDSNFGK